MLLQKGVKMTSNQLLLEGVELMFFGLGFVFLFLIMLVGAIRVMSRLIELFAPHTPVPAAAQSFTKSAIQQPDADVLAAIQSAINQHRARRG
jgi:oxaloacetate decarboxylase gamma subunit